MLIVIARGINEAVEVRAVKDVLDHDPAALSFYQIMDLLLDIDPRGLLKLQIAIAAL